MLLTIDASVAIKWIIDEPGSIKARTYIAQYQALEGGVLEYTFRAPSLIALELHNAIARRHRRGEATLDQLVEAQFALRYLGAIDPVDSVLIDTARQMSFVAKHWAANIEGRPRPPLGSVFNIYDRIYLAHAMIHVSTLLTADKEQADAAKTFSIPVELIPTE